MRSHWGRRLAPVLLVGLIAAMTGCSGSTSTPSAGQEDGVAVPASAGAPAVGTYRVSTRTLDLVDPSRVTDEHPTKAGGETAGRRLPTTIWYPATGQGPFPVVAFSHGVLSTASTYDELLAAWASAGFIVLGPTFPLTNHDVETVYVDILNQPADVSFALTATLALNTTTGDDLEGRIDTEHIAAAGHSGGAVTTIGLLNNCCADDRITAAIVMAGTLTGFGGSFEAPGVPALFLHGTADDTVPFTDGRAAYQAYPGPKAFISLLGGVHPGPYNDKPEDTHFSTVLATTTDFLCWSLAGDGTALAAMQQAAGKTGVAELTADRLGG
jgi:fermentation-respiration switch protein FrsA (DUF1100 family)